MRSDWHQEKNVVWNNALASKFIAVLNLKKKQKDDDIMYNILAAFDITDIITRTSFGDEITNFDQQRKYVYEVLRMWMSKTDITSLYNSPDKNIYKVTLLQL